MENSHTMPSRRKVEHRCHSRMANSPRRSGYNEHVMSKRSPFEPDREREQILSYTNLGAANMIIHVGRAYFIIAITIIAIITEPCRKIKVASGRGRCKR